MITHGPKDADRIMLALTTAARLPMLTEGVAIIAIFPMVFARGVGGEILAPMALPVLGGLLISDEVVDLFLPVRFYWIRRRRWLKLHQAKAEAAAHLS
jgi:Cu(I)/Ag(I) efflux system membrane protein CusA/SilA